MFAIKAGTIITPTRIINDAYIIVDGAKIADISKTRPQKMEGIYNYEQYILAPGLVDIHTHGGFGIDVMHSTASDLSRLCTILPVTGVTYFMPTLMTDSFENIQRTISTTKNMPEKEGVSKIMGLHLEGPYLSPEKCGAQPREFIREPSIEEFGKFYKKGGELLKRITIAPEIPGSIGFIKSVIRDFGVKVSLGHTNANYEQAMEAFKAGATIVIHLWDGMRGFNHRDPGIVGAALTKDYIYTEAIADLVHLHPSTLNLTLRCKKPSKMVLITDATPGAGLPDGNYTLGMDKVIIKDGIARLEDGTLAGSTLTMINAVRNMVRIGTPLDQAIRMASLTPAKALGLKNIGKIEKGYRASFIALTRDLEIAETYVDGKMCEIKYNDQR